MMSKKPAKSSLRNASQAEWQVSTAHCDTSTPSDVWGGDAKTTSSELLRPSTPFSSSSSPDELDAWATTPSSSSASSTDPFDLFGTTETVRPSRCRSKAKNPFTPQCDPFAEVWAEDGEHHFWWGELMMLQSV